MSDVNELVARLYGKTRFDRGIKEFLDERREAAATIEALQALVVELNARERMIVSHATGGSLDLEGKDMSINDISVEITRHTNAVYQGGKDSVQAQVAAKDAEIGRIKEAQKAVAEINRFARICIADSAQGINPHWLASEAKVIGAHLRAALGQGEG